MSVAIAGCSTAMLEARLEANPQCKDVINPKTGALMPCPGSDRAFYVSAGVMAPKAAKPVTPDAAPTNTVSNSVAVAPAASSSPKPSSTNQPECKPHIHQKTGSLVPCLPPD